MVVSLRQRLAQLILRLDLQVTVATVERMRALAQNVGLHPDLGTAAFARPVFNGFQKRNPDAAVASGLVDDEPFEVRPEAFDERLVDRKGRPSYDTLAIGRDENVAPFS